MQTQTQTRRVDTDKFVDWCRAQIENSRSITSRIIANNDERVKYRIREGDSVEDIELLKGKNVDSIRFMKDGETRGFHAHRRKFTFHDKTMIVRTKDGQEICRAGTGTRNKKGPFPL